MGKRDGATKKTASQVFVEYFDLVDSYFGNLRRHLADGDASHIDLGHKIAAYPLISDLILDSIEGLGERIYHFWRENHAYVKNHIDDHSGLKCIYSGDISPFSLERFIKKSALYVDTVILPDPLLNLAYFMKPSVIDNKFYLNKLVRHVFNLWRMRNLISAGTDYPIIIVYPLNIHLLSEEREHSLSVYAGNQYLRYLSELFGREFNSEIELSEFLVKLLTARDLFKQMKRVEVLPGQYRTYEGLSSLIHELGKTAKYFRPTKKGMTAGEWFGQYIRSQFTRVQEHKFFCERFVAEPIYDHQPAWFFLNHELGGQDIDSAILNALQREQFEWLGGIPLSVIPKLREENELGYMRRVLREGILSIRARKDRDLSSVVDQLQKNLEEAFMEQKAELSRIRTKVTKILKKEIPITTIGALLGYVPLLGNFLSLPFLTRDLLRSHKEYKTARKEIREKQKTAVNLLMKSYEDQGK